jgi:hypothetical protein
VHVFPNGYVQQAERLAARSRSVCGEPSSQRDSRERGMRLRRPWWVTGQRRHQCERLLRGSFPTLERFLVTSKGADPRGFQCELRENLAASGGATLIRGKPDGSLEMGAHRLRVVGRRTEQSAPRL